MLPGYLLATVSRCLTVQKMNAGLSGYGHWSLSFLNSLAAGFFSPSSLLAKLRCFLSRAVRSNKLSSELLECCFWDLQYLQIKLTNLKIHHHPIRIKVGSSSSRPKFCAPVETPLHWILKTSTNPHQGVVGNGLDLVLSSLPHHVCPNKRFSGMSILSGTTVC